MTGKLSVLAVALALVAAGAAADEPYPTRPITIVNPFPPGGLSDVVARLARLPEAPTVKGLGHVKALRDAVRTAVQSADFKKATDNARLVIAYQDAEEFKAWRDRDAQAIAATVKAIGKLELK